MSSCAELISVEIPLAIIKTLTENYSVDTRIKSLVDNRDIWIVPMLNPDGHVYVEEEDSMWRKNRNTNGYSDPTIRAWISTVIIAFSGATIISVPVPSHLRKFTVAQCLSLSRKPKL